MPFNDYYVFARANLRFLAFGFLVAFTSSAGQTFFIGVFGPEVRAAFSLSHTEWGSIYMIGTLSSAAVLTWSGGLIDRFDLRVFAGLAIAGLVLLGVNGSTEAPLQPGLVIQPLRPPGADDLREGTTVLLRQLADVRCHLLTARNLFDFL